MWLKIENMLINSDHLVRIDKTLEHTILTLSEWTQDSGWLGSNEFVKVPDPDGALFARLTEQLNAYIF